MQAADPAASAFSDPFTRTVGEQKDSSSVATNIDIPVSASKKRTAQEHFSIEEAPLKKKQCDTIGFNSGKRNISQGLDGALPRQTSDETPIELVIAKPVTKQTNPVTDNVDGTYVTAKPRDAVGLDQSLLSRLPLELRQQIYSYVLHAPWEFIRLVRQESIAVGTRKRSRFIALPVGSWQICSHSHRTAVLWTCRQIYTEAIDSLYQRIPFYAELPSVFMAFATIVAPQQFDKIRHLHFFLYRKHYLAKPVWKFESQSRSEWNTFWVTIAGIRHLRTLNVDIVFPVRAIRDAKDQSMCQAILRPLLALSGLQDFSLEFEIRRVGQHGELCQAKIPLWPQTHALIESISDAAAKPRIDLRDLN
ncbi:MAG: hypothetical protein Q9209_005436 [Squamulea sp. 1 TL-2023]